LLKSNALYLQTFFFTFYGFYSQTWFISIAVEKAFPHLLTIRTFLASNSLTANFILPTFVFRNDIIKFLSNVNSDSKYYEPDHWKFGTEGNNYFRHATRQLYAVTRDLATYISANR